MVLKSSKHWHVIHLNEFAYWKSIKHFPRGIKILCRKLFTWTIRHTSFRLFCTRFISWYFVDDRFQTKYECLIKFVYFTIGGFLLRILIGDLSGGQPEMFRSTGASYWYKIARTCNQAQCQHTKWRSNPLRLNKFRFWVDHHWNIRVTWNQRIGTAFTVHLDKFHPLFQNGRRTSGWYHQQTQQAGFLWLYSEQNETTPERPWQRVSVPPNVTQRLD